MLQVPRTRPLRLSQRLFLTNAAVLVVAALALALSPATVSFPVSADEALVLAAGLVAMLVADLILFRRAFAPLERLADVMRSVDPLEPGRRVPAARAPELAALASSFNAMLERLEAERRDSARRALAAQEAERRRIARELHDEVGQTLTAVMLRLDHAARDAGPAARPLEDVIEHLRGALEEVRRIACGLRPVTLDELGLPPALQALAREANEATGLRISVDLPPALPELPADVELVVYRIAQEALTNVVRHAGGRAAALSLAVGSGTARLTVADDGPGPGDAEGSGIRGMRERALLLGGQLDVATGDAGGTKVTLTVPVEKVAA